jgi:hypothetical protein
VAQRLLGANTLAENKIYRQPVRPESIGATTDISPAAQARVDSVRAGGRPLPESVRSFFEPRFGHDFGPVRIHTDARAGESAQSVNALAYTAGRDVVFAQGHFAPHTSAGQRLLAHELAHVIQQGGAGPASAPSASWVGTIQRQEPVTTTAGTVTIGAVIGKCILGAITGVLFDAVIQAAIHSIKKWTLRFWRTTLDYCSLFISAVLGCIAAPISAFVLEGWVTTQLGRRLGAMSGTLLGKILIYLAKKLAIQPPKFLVSQLLKLGCVSPEQAAELGVSAEAEVECAGEAPYIPTDMSRMYWRLSPVERAEVNTKADEVFRSETGVTRKLDWDNPRDRPCARRWLRIRDEVMATWEPRTPTEERSQVPPTKPPAPKAEGRPKRVVEEEPDIGDRLIEEARRLKQELVGGGVGRGAIRRITFNGRRVEVQGTPSFTAPAVSGLQPHHPEAHGIDYTNPRYQDVPLKGPVPEGSYFVTPAVVESNPPGTFAVEAWGRYRTRLQEPVLLKAHRRLLTDRGGGFFLHEDANKNGTYGCIGLRSPEVNERIHRLIKANVERIPVEVRYPAVTP